jgi:DNA-3-methyladenine glycosylase
MGLPSVTGARSSSAARGSRLGRAFFDRPTAEVARSLLGTRLVVRHRDGARAGRLVESEAYVGRDPANHAWLGPTARNLAMFGPPGTLYVYRIHQVVCANLVTRPGEAVLLRAAEPLSGLDENLSGPGRLCRGLGITIRDNGEDAAAGPRVSLHAVPGRVGPIVAGPRIGIRRAVDRPLRFALPHERAVSRPRPGRSVGP